MKRLLLILAAVFCFQQLALGASCSSSSVGSGITCVQSASAVQTTSQSTIAKAYTSNITSGSLLIADVGWICAGGETISGVADTRSQTWTQVGSTVTVNAGVGGNWCLAMFRFYNSASGADTVTATLSASVAETQLAIHEYSGLATTLALDQTSGNPQVDPNTGMDAVTSGTTSATSTANELVHGATLAISTIQTEAAGSTFTLREGPVAGTFSSFLTEDKLLATATTTAATFTDGLSTTDNATIVGTFKKPGAAATTRFLFGGFF